MVDRLFPGLYGQMTAENNHAAPCLPPRNTCWQIALGHPIRALWRAGNRALAVMVTGLAQSQVLGYKDTCTCGELKRDHRDIPLCPGAALQHSEENTGSVVLGQLLEYVLPRAVQQRRNRRCLAHFLACPCPWCVVQMSHPSPCVLPCNTHIHPVVYCRQFPTPGWLALCLPTQHSKVDIVRHCCVLCPVGSFGQLVLLLVCVGRRNLDLTLVLGTDCRHLLSRGPG